MNATTPKSYMQALVGSMDRGPDSGIHCAGAAAVTVAGLRRNRPLQNERATGTFGPHCRGNPQEPQKGVSPTALMRVRHGRERHVTENGVVK